MNGEIIFIDKELKKIIIKVCAKGVFRDNNCELDRCSLNNR